ncbi:MAG: Yip1 family protein [Halobaculum sp.]
MFRNPDAFFERQATDPSMIAPTACVLLAMFASILGPTYVMGRLVQQASGGVTVFLALGGTLGLFSSSLSLILLWFSHSIAFHFVARRLGGDHDFRDMFFVSGFGFLPYVFSGLLGFFAVFHVFSGVALPTESAALEQTVTALAQSTPIVLARGVGTLFLLWAGLLWTFGIKHVADLPFQRAVLPAAVPTLLSVGWELSQAMP